jgi:hypothetical protein
MLIIVYKKLYLNENLKKHLSADRRGMSFNRLRFDVRHLNKYRALINKERVLFLQTRFNSKCDHQLKFCNWNTSV